MRFVKMTGAGNDFIAVDNRGGALSQQLGREAIARMCSRALSIGADGLLELRESSSHLFRMRYYNSDGGAAEMCGNGGRCIAVFARMLGIAGDEAFSFESDAGSHRALVCGPGEARIWMTEPKETFLERELALPKGTARVSLVDTGVPHAVELSDGLDDTLFSNAALIRSHSQLGSAGANYDLVARRGNGLAIRTWERGVEGETLACGTGAAAVTVAGVLTGRTQRSITNHLRGGDLLLEWREDGEVLMTGPAVEVFSGVYSPG